MDPQELAALLAPDPSAREAQRAEIAFRCRLIDRWKVMAGERVLELGCGQGDATIVLADRVGPAGAVLAVDAAGPGYGAPVTIGASMDRLRTSALGPRIDVRLGSEIEDVDGPFDRAVMVHGSWYVASYGRLLQVLRQALRMAPRLCLSDWDLVPSRADQFAHHAAISLQMQARGLGLLTDGNVRTPVTREQVREAVVEAGWTPAAEEAIATSQLPDGAWEVATALAVAPEAIAAASEGGRSARAVWLRTQQEVLLQARRLGVASLDSWWMCARR